MKKTAFSHPLPSIPSVLHQLEHSPFVSRCREQTIIRCCRALPESTVFISTCPVIFPDCRNTTLILSWLLVKNLPDRYVQKWLLPYPSFFLESRLILVAPTHSINKWRCRISNMTLLSLHKYSFWNTEGYYSSGGGAACVMPVFGKCMIIASIRVLGHCFIQFAKII